MAPFAFHTLFTRVPDVATTITTSTTTAATATTATATTAITGPDAGSASSHQLLYLIIAAFFVFVALAATSAYLVYRFVQRAKSSPKTEGSRFSLRPFLLRANASRESLGDVEKATAISNTNNISRPILITFTYDFSLGGSLARSLPDIAARGPPAFPVNKNGSVGPTTGEETQSASALPGATEVIGSIAKTLPVHVSESQPAQGSDCPPGAQSGAVAPVPSSTGSRTPEIAKIKDVVSTTKEVTGHSSSDNDQAAPTAASSADNGKHAIPVTKEIGDALDMSSGSVGESESGEYAVTERNPVDQEQTQSASILSITSPTKARTPAIVAGHDTKGISPTEGPLCDSSRIWSSDLFISPTDHRLGVVGVEEYADSVIDSTTSSTVSYEESSVFVTTTPESSICSNLSNYGSDEDPNKGVLRRCSGDVGSIMEAELKLVLSRLELKVGPAANQFVPEPVTVTARPPKCATFPENYYLRRDARTPENQQKEKRLRDPGYKKNPHKPLQSSRLSPRDICKSASNDTKRYSRETPRLGNVSVSLPDRNTSSKLLVDVLTKCHLERYEGWDDSQLVAVFLNDFYDPFSGSRDADSFIPDPEPLYLASSTPVKKRTASSAISRMGSRKDSPSVARNVGKALVPDCSPPSRSTRSSPSPTRITTSSLSHPPSRLPIPTRLMSPSRPLGRRPTLGKEDDDIAAFPTAPSSIERRLQVSPSVPPCTPSRPRLSSSPPVPFTPTKRNSSSPFTPSPREHKHTLVVRLSPGVVTRPCCNVPLSPPSPTEQVKRTLRSPIVGIKLSANYHKPTHVSEAKRRDLSGRSLNSAPSAAGKSISGLKFPSPPQKGPSPPRSARRPITIPKRTDERLK